MTWFGILLVLYWAVNALTSVLLVGKSLRYTPVGVACQVSIYVLLVWGVLAVGTNP